MPINRLTVDFRSCGPYRLGRSRMNSAPLASTIRSRSGGPYRRTPSLILFFLSRWIRIGRPLLRRPPRAPSRTPASAPWQRKSWASSVLSLPRPRQRVRAFNAGQCTAPVCPLFTCSRRSSRLCAAENPERTRGTSSRCSLPS